MFNLSLLRGLPCEQIAPVLHAMSEGREGTPQQILESLQRQVAAVVEVLFRNKGERTLIFGCMHYEASASQSFLQTQTAVYDLLPQNVCGHGEDHSHKKAVTVDVRVSPDEIFGLPIETGQTLNAIPHKAVDVSPSGPDFARRNVQVLTHLDDFKYVRNVNKVYVERMPFLEKGPHEENFSNLDFFARVHQLLSSDGILSFDYIPTLAVFNSQGEPVSYCHSIATGIQSVKITTSDQEVKDFVRNSPYSEFLKKITNYHVSIVPFLQCQSSCGPCSKNTPCAQVALRVARSALQAMKEGEELKKLLEPKRAEITKRKKAVLTEEEVFIGTKSNPIPLKNLKELLPSDFPLNEFAINQIFIRCHAGRTTDEKESLDYQVESFRALNVNPALLDQVDPETKRVLDLALVTLVNKVVFPQLKMLHFEGVAFDPNRQNPENKRPFERVIHAKKIEVT